MHIHVLETTYRLQANLKVVSSYFQHWQVGEAPLSSNYGVEQYQGRQNASYHLCVLRIDEGHTHA